ncbi:MULTISPECIES: PaaI family thioesterase [Methylobacterium]|jgi:uncharacterized protein (TIGR00369 family)|uniref:Thioesterase domain-containing protein n=1 Tax=Methylobacterium isbiliense TaxID=315478 RepID=A0ABQ4S6G0_9HYPH|nr:MULTISPECIES: PaaI family thioesterase [Methylobacterium]MBY0297028.1 PaaI family thioesterase [Methylobacterium sp.]MDN3625528.1 PaaI family thioesterase [Methylobacterium isbiliense]GJD98666.1 hypothetical protein GMJLKIPL_0577 [Methylobacterium isbiliense]
MDGGDDGMIFGADIPFARHCGVEALGFRDGRTRLRLALGPEHANNLGIAHGGILCTLLDIAMGTVARLTAGRPVVTLDMQTRFLAPGRGVLLAEGRVARAGQSILFCDAEVRSAETNALVASASGVFKPTGLREARERRAAGSGQDEAGSAANG